MIAPQMYHPQAQIPPQNYYVHPQYQPPAQFVPLNYSQGSMAQQVTLGLLMIFFNSPFLFFSVKTTNNEKKKQVLVKRM